jgi:hypothetical protein
LRRNSFDTIHFRMRLTVLLVPAFPDDALPMNEYRTNHGVGRYMTTPLTGQLHTTQHIGKIDIHTAANLM